jgi:hypothetical protein
MRVKTIVLITAAALTALPAKTYARALSSTNSVDDHVDVLVGRAPLALVIPAPKPAPKPEPEPAPVAPGAPKAPGGNPKVSDGPAHLSIPESGLAKPTVTPAESVAPTTGPAEPSAPTATQAKSVAPSATEPKPVAPTEPAQGSGDGKPSKQCKRGILGARCASDSGDDSEPVFAPAREQPPSGSWYEFVNDPSKVQNSRTQFNQRINNPIADDLPTGSLSKYELEAEQLSNSDLIDVQSAGIGSILTELGRRGEIVAGGKASRVEIRSGNPPENGHPTRDDVQETGFTDDGKMIVARFSDARNDGTPANDKMPWDQLAFLQYKQLSGDKIGQLQFIGRSQISNKATLNTMLDAFGHSGRSTSQQMGQVLTVRSVQDGAVAGGPEAQAFDALSWSDNVNGVYWLLSDFHNALGNKRISQFHLKFNNPGNLDAAAMRDAFKKDAGGDKDPEADILIELATA